MLPWMIRAAALVPLLAGGGGAVLGPALLGEAAGPATDSHLRYLSGLLLGVGLVALWCAADLPRRRDVFLALAVLVVLGGLARMGGALAQGWPPLPHGLALLMEIGVVPLLAALVGRAYPRHTGRHG
jgi:peptidoglycan/LPS O-acetylase OafA/YrhL